jgi:signal peptidase I
MKKLMEDNQLIVPQGNYFVMGDNRDDSLDSRYWGFVPRENVVGRPLVIYWSMRNPDPPAGADTAGDKLYRLFYALSHIMQITRWDRTLRLVQ